MFAGHAAIAAFAAATRPRIPFLPLLVAAYGADVLEIALHGAGLAHVQAMQWSHSITAVIAGGLVFAAAAYGFFRRPDVAVLAGLVYASHWACDLITGEGKPTWIGGPRIGFALYQQPVIDFALETLLVITAALAYQWRRPTRRRLIVLVAVVLVALQLGFNVGDRARLHGLKRNLVRATSAALEPGESPAVGDRVTPLTERV